MLQYTSFGETWYKGATFTLQKRGLFTQSLPPRQIQLAAKISV